MVGLVDGFRENEINKDKVIQLETDISIYKNKVSLTEGVVEQTEGMIKDKESVIAVVDEQANLTKRQIRKLKTKAAFDWMGGKWREFTIGVGALGVGVGIGYLAK